MLLQLLPFFSAHFLYLALHLESGSFPRRDSKKGGTVWFHPFVAVGC